MPIVNRTPHPISILPATAGSDTTPTLVLPAAQRGEVARVESTTRPYGTATVYEDDVGEAVRYRQLHEPSGTIDIVGQTWGAVVGVGAPPTLQIVSAIVAAQMIAQGQDTRHVLVPADQVRDGTGRIVGCRGLLRAEDAVPRLGPVPQLIVYGSAVRTPAEAHDLDVAYAGMDLRTALRIARSYIDTVLIPQVQHACDGPLALRGDLPIDARCAEVRDGEMVLPRPGNLPGEDLPLDDAAVVVFGPRRYRWQDCRGLPAVLRRAAALLQRATTVAQVMPWLVAGLARPHTLALCEEPPAGELDGDAYDAPTLGQVRRALAKLEQIAPGLLEDYAGAEMASFRLRVLEPYRLLRAFLDAKPAQLRRLADLVCPPGSAPSKSPRWQADAGRLEIRTHSGETVIGGAYSRAWMPAQQAIDMLREGFV